MKILVVGDGHSKIHEVAVSNAFDKLGYQVKTFYWHKYFQSSNIIKKIYYRFQNKFIIGHLITKINRDFSKKAIIFDPDMIFIYRGTHILPHYLVNLKSKISKCKIIGYNNDDPFSDDHPHYLWRHFIKAIKTYDLIFAYRHKNLEEFLNKKAKKVALLRSWFIPEINFPVPLSENDIYKYETDLVFIGHYENDGRLEFLEEIVKAGFKLKIFGPPYEWNKIVKKSNILKELYPINSIWDIEYSKAISAAKIALCFFSKLNRDTYTRRCFEIPAIGTMLFSEYSEDMSNLFLEGKEIEFFKSTGELITKINLYLKNDELRKTVAYNGHQRVIKDRHDIVSRMKCIINHYKALN